MRWTLTSVAAIIAVSTFHVSGLTPPQPPGTTFRSGVELITLEASVRDRGNEPVTDLQPSDFTVRIDGKPRHVVFARLFRGEAARITVGDAAIATRHVTNEEAAPGQILVLVVDRDALPAGYERTLLASASRLLEQLSAADAVGLVNIPGPVVDVTRDHARVADALKSIVGTRPARASTHNVTWDEAVAFERGDKPVMATVYARECRSGPGDAFCPQDVRLAAHEALTSERAHVQTLLPALESVIRNLAPLRAPKHLVVLSSGLVFAPEFVDQFKDIERAAAEARVTIDTVRLHEFQGDASSDSGSGAMIVGDPGTSAGLDNISTLTGGLAFTGAGRAVGIFNRIASEVTTFYLLGVESSAADADGKLHDVKLSVNRPDVSTRVRPSVAVPARERRGKDALDSALQQPTDVSDVPIAVTTYTVHGPDSAPRVVLAAEIGAPGSAAPAEWGYVVLQNGKSIATTRGRIPAGPERPRIVSSTIALPAGAYRVRIAAVDAEGRAGSLETEFGAGFRPIPGAHVSDLIVGATTGKQLEPRRRMAQSEELTALLELGPADAAAGVSAVLQLVRGGTAQAAATIPFSIRPPSGAGEPATLQAQAPLADVAPGRYTANAVIRAGDKTIAAVSRALEVTSSPAAAAPLPATAPPPPEAAAPAPTIATWPTSDALMHRVASYVERYGEQASAIVMLERYRQQSTSPGIGNAVGRVREGYTSGTVTSPLMNERTLLSELALVRNSAAIGGWLAFRDVVEANGKAVQDRKDRLASIFEQRTPDLDEARRITAESARYNIGPVKRTFNVPTATLFFFHPANLVRFKFREKGRERVGGVDAALIEFQEIGKPTVVMNANGHDIPSSGILWIDPNDGTVLQTRLLLSGYAGPRSFVRVEVAFQRDAKLQMWVPSQMDESYGVGSSTLTGRAIYTDAKRFTTTIRVK